MSFTDKLLALYRKVSSAKTYQERRDAMMDLATQYAREHDDTDQEINEEFHQLVEEFETAHQMLVHSALSLGRAVTAALDAEESVDEDVATAPSAPRKKSVKGGNLPN